MAFHSKRERARDIDPARTGQIRTAINSNQMHPRMPKSNFRSIVGKNMTKRGAGLGVSKDPGRA